MISKELDMLACRTYVCPNMGLIEEKGKELGLDDRIIERAKNMAVEYFKKTYHKPHYSSAKYVLPSFIYLAAILEGEKRTQDDVAEAFGVTIITIKKWYRDIMATLNMEMSREKKGVKSPDLCTESMFMDEIDKEGRALLLKDKTIERAKEMASRYFTVKGDYGGSPNVKNISAAFIYMASVLENDRRTQLRISEVSGVSGSVISKWYNDALCALSTNVLRERKKGRVPDLRQERIFIDEIEKEGRVLSLEDKTIKRAKELLSRYLKLEEDSDNKPSVKNISAALVYLASIFENDRRTQMEISEASGVSECTISKWYNFIVRSFGMKIIINGDHFVCVIEEEG